MLIGNSRRLKSMLVLLVCGVLAFASAKYLTAKLLNMKSAPNQSEGFDFNYIVNSANMETGPRIGERIDLENLKGPDGNSLAETIDRPALIVAVNRGCGMCRTSADEMNEIQRRLKPAGVQYYTVSFGTSPTPAEFFKFADSLNRGAPAFLRSMNEGNPPKQLTAMLVPTHFLIDRNGVIISKWPGSSNVELVRHRMANQIVSDTLATLSARSSHEPH